MQGEPLLAEVPANVVSECREWAVTWVFSGCHEWAEISKTISGCCGWIKWLLCCLYPNPASGEAIFLEDKRVDKEKQELDWLEGGDPLRKCMILWLVSTLAAEAAVLIVIFALLRVLYETPRAMCYGEMTQTLPMSCVSLVLAWQPTIRTPLVRTTYIGMLCLSFAVGCSSLIDLSSVNFPSKGAKYGAKLTLKRHRGNLTILLVMCMATFGVEAMRTGKDIHYCVVPTESSASDAAWHGASVEVVFGASAAGSWWSYKRASAAGGWQPTVPVMMTMIVLTFELLGLVCFLLFYNLTSSICKYYGNLYNFAIYAARAMWFEAFALLFLLSGLLVRTHCDFMDCVDLIGYMFAPRFLKSANFKFWGGLAGLGLLCVILISGLVSNPGYLIFYPAESEWILPCTPASVRNSSAAKFV